MGSSLGSFSGQELALTLSFHVRESTEHDYLIGTCRHDFGMTINGGHKKWVYA
jgi:hypothetical protein